jgi:exodeoxyribonuclease-5
MSTEFQSADDDVMGEGECVEIPEITPSDMQKKAIDDICDWYRNRSREQKIYRLFGYAGSGKTTITKYAIGQLGLSMFAPPRRKRVDTSMFSNIDDALESYTTNRVIPDVYFGAFTGKASLVMRRHGTPAQTIHSMIMNSYEATDEQIEEAEKKLLTLISAVDGKSGDERLLAITAANAFRNTVEMMKKPGWSPDPFADAGQSKLIVLDEVSMVDEELAGYVMSYGVPVLVIGDPGQLPPIHGEGAFTAKAPDMMLTEIHRQALDSPIIRLATMAREGRYISMGDHGGDVWKMSKMHVGIDQLLMADQVICGLNATRYQLNAAMRNRLGFNQFSKWPSGQRLPNMRGQLAPEKIICLKNNHRDGLINGMFIEVNNSKQDTENTFFAEILTEMGDHIPDGYCYAGFFENHYNYDKERESRDWKVRRRTIESTYGYAITCHKAQGSQFGNVIVYNDGWGRGSEQRRKWLYTAITRAENGLLILE